MNLKEHPFVSDHLDSAGVREGDIMALDPLTGRKQNMALNRTCIDLISKDLEGCIESHYYRVLPAQQNESFQVQIKLIETLGKRCVKKKRYVAKVLSGSPIKLNGNYVYECLLEENDCLEIGFNRLKMKRDNDLELINVQEQLIKEHKRIVSSTLPLMIVGETGVGKTTLAKMIHENSGRAGGFVHLNISAFSKSLVESELFGHVKGAFTGALNAKNGAFREANGGTLFIDEIDSLSMELQTKLLTFLDSYKARAVGADRDYQVNIRLIFSSGQDLQQLVQRGLMRRDFYYRITSGHIFKLKALRDDVRLIDRYCRSYMLKNNIILSKKLIEFYQSLPWPGNYRQLKGHIDRKLVLGNSWKLDFDDIDAELIAQSSELADIQEMEAVLTLEDVKSAYAKKIFFQSGKNYKQAAAKLKISPRSLKRMVCEQSEIAN